MKNEIQKDKYRQMVYEQKKWKENQATYLSNYLPINQYIHNKSIISLSSYPYPIYLVVYLSRPSMYYGTPPRRVLGTYQPLPTERERGEERRRKQQ